jgi:arylsulfatase A-like enzyme/Flp pilus assembly protein TadD
LGCYGFRRAHTPEIDRLAAEGTRFADAVSAAPITMPAHSSILTGLLPPAHGVRDNGSYALSDKAVTLAERLKAAGFRTQAIVSALVLNRRYNLAQGFDGYDDDLWAEDDPKLFMIRDRKASKTVDRALAWLAGWAAETPRKPFFLWVHFFDPHQPYEAPAAEVARAVHPYDAEIAVVDRAIGGIVGDLRQRDLLDDTLIVLTADHGESLGEHGEKTHAIFIYDATVHVPLILRHPGAVPHGKVYEGPVRSIDIVPTVLAALGLPGGEETQGIDLLPAVRGAAPAPDLPQYSESLLSEVGFGMAPLYGVRHGGWTWIRAPRPELYDLEKDPRELRNLYPGPSDIARRGARLDRDLQALLDDSRRRALPADVSPVDRGTLEALQALGYVAPRAARESMGGIDPKDGMVLYAKLEDARHLAQQKRWPAAQALLEEVLRATPKNVSAINILALCRLRQGHLAEARAEYLRALAIDPGQARVYVMLGLLSLLEGDLDGAERLYRQALRISPRFVEAISNLGMIAALRGDDAGAEQWYREAIAADPGFPWVWRRLADLWYERGDFAKALAGYRKTLAVVPDDWNAVLQAGNCARRVGDPTAAAAYFERAGEIRPDSWIPVYNLACLRAVQGDAPAALQLLHEATAKGLRRAALLREDRDLATVRALPGWGSLLAEVERNGG